jgi:hypothetical protein
MASFTAGTTFVDGVANDVTAAKLGALVTNATPTSGFIKDRTQESIIATNDTLLFGDASDTDALKRITVASFAQTLPTAKITTGTIDTGTFGTTTSTAATITTLTAGTTTSTAATITTGTIPTLTSITKITSGTGTAAAPAISPTGDTNTGIFFPAADTVAFAEGGAEAMRINSSGNVGIGTTIPSQLLEVGAEGIANTYIQVSASNNTAAGIKFRSDLSLTGGYDIGYDGSGNNFFFKSDTGGTVTERMRIDASGNVGIGATSPTELLEVGNDSTSNNYIQVSAANNTASGIKFRSDQSKTTGWDVGYEGDGNYLFFRHDSLGTVTERVRVDASGNVGIGTTPTAKLDVSGSFNATSGTIATLNSTTGTIPTLVATTLITTGTGTAAAPAIVPTGDTNTGIFFPAADTIAFSEGGTEAMRINSSGNVSIGTATALSKLHVHGDLTMSNATTAITASTSTITPPATVAGYLTVSINGTSRKIAYYAT